MIGGQEPNELQTTHIGGGRSARLMALGIALVLGAFVFIGISGRQSPPQVPAVANASPIASADAPFATPEPSARATRPPAEAVTQIPSGSSNTAGDEPIAVVFELAGMSYEASMDETAPGRWQAAYRIPFPRPALLGSIALTQAAASSEAIATPLGRWDVSLEPMTLGWQRIGTVLDVAERPSRNPGAPGLQGTGYSVSVVAESRLHYGVLSIDVRRGTGRQLPDESYAVDARAGRFATRVTLADAGSGRFSGVLPLPARVTADHLALTLVAMPSRNPLLGMVRVHDISLILLPADEFQSGHSVILNSAAMATGPGVPDLLTFNHRLSAETVFDGRDRSVVLHLQIFGAAEEPEVAEGDDFADMGITWPPRIAPTELLVYRDWPLRQLKDDLAVLYRRLVDLER